MNRQKSTLENEDYTLLQFYKDPLLIFFALLLPILWYFKRDALATLPSYIHWPTIVALSGLLMITNCFKYSGLFSKLASRLLKQANNERNLWIGLILFSAIIATFLTNDIALFLVIPFTMQLNRMADLNIIPLFIFETIAVNAGSLITDR
ncbi:MAG TPA: SLC13 family permease [Balneolaceae bacterium]|nr:SLC13 family permease [Balneolaceae bacterium]